MGIFSQFFGGSKDQNRARANIEDFLARKIAEATTEFVGMIIGLQEEKNFPQQNTSIDDEGKANIALEFSMFITCLIAHIRLNDHLQGRSNIELSNLSKGNIDAKMKNLVMNECIFLITITSKVLGVLLPDSPKKIRQKLYSKWLDKRMESRLKLYKKCEKWFPDDNEEGRDGTLFWEFSKEIAKLANRENNIIFVAAAHRATVLYAQKFGVSYNK